MSPNEAVNALQSHYGSCELCKRGDYCQLFIGLYDYSQLMIAQMFAPSLPRRRDAQ